jgi:hypothetical protein
MWLFLVLLWCSSVAGRGGRLGIAGNDSLFLRFIRVEIPCLGAMGIYREGTDFALGFGGQTGVFDENRRKFPVMWE